MRARGWNILFWTFSLGILGSMCLEEGREQKGASLPAEREDAAPLYLISTETQDLGFERGRRKYSRRLWYINCTRRRRCHCYSRRLRQYFCCDCDSGPCFPGNAEVILRPSGVPTQMQRLRLGQYVLAANEHGDLVDSKVLGFLDKRPNETAAYITLVLDSGQSVSLSATHLIYAKSRANASLEDLRTPPSEPVYAEQVRPGDLLFVAERGQLKSHAVARISYGLMTGAYVPLTQHGTIVVDGALASCYASFPHWLAHSALTPARIFPQILLDTEETQDHNGLRTLPFILKKIAKAISRLFSIRSYISTDVIKFFPHEESFISSQL